MRDDPYEGLPPSFAEACRKADNKQRQKPKNPYLERLRTLMDDSVSLEQAYAEIQAMREWRK